MCVWRQGIHAKPVYIPFTFAVNLKLLFFFFLFFYFIFKLYITVLVLPNIKMNPPQVYMCSPSWTLLPPPSPFHPSGSSQCSNLCFNKPMKWFWCMLKFDICWPKPKYVILKPCPWQVLVHLGWCGSPIIDAFKTSPRNSYWQSELSLWLKCWICTLWFLITICSPPREKIRCPHLCLYGSWHVGWH